MMTAAELGQSLAAEGRPVHEHDGVWWVSRGALFCQTVHEFQVLTPGVARPSRRKALVGYSHQVPPGESASRHLDFLILEEEPLRQFGIECLGKGRRNTVRRGLKDLAIEPIREIEGLLGELQRISADQAARQRNAGYASRGPEYFFQQSERWRKEMREEFGRKGARWWGAWRQGRLVAFVTTLAVDGVFYVRTAKSETASLRSCPNDALYFEMLAYAKEHPGIVRVVNGNPIRPSLDRFKEEFGFRKARIPYFTTPMCLFATTKAIRAALSTARSSWRSRRQGGPGYTTGAEARREEAQGT